MHPRALLVVSFGTCCAETRKRTIMAAENALASAFPDYDLRRAFTSHMVIHKLGEQGGFAIDTVTQAAERLSSNGYQEVLVQPLHIINGTEYHQVLKELKPYAHRFKKLAIGRPLLTYAQDYFAVVEALHDELPSCAKDEAVVWMGHGSCHPANAAYLQLDYVFKDLGCPRVYVGTVEGYPTIDTVIKRLEADDIKRVTLLPFMLVAGEHARNDMAGDGENSWKTILERRGYAVAVRLVGLGEIEKIRQVYVAHAWSALHNRAED